MRLYTVTVASTAFSTAVDLFEITPADDKPVAIVGLSLDNVGGTADAGDAQEELLSVQFIRGFTVSGSGGSAPTPTPLQTADAAAGFAAETLNTTLANTSTTTTPIAIGWNVRVPLREFWPIELCPTVSQANTSIVVRLPAPADPITISATLWVAEL